MTRWQAGAPARRPRARVAAGRERVGIVAGVDVLAHRVHRHLAAGRARARLRGGAADGRRASGAPPGQQAELRRDVHRLIAEAPGMSSRDSADLRRAGNRADPATSRATSTCLSVEQLVSLMCADVRRVPEAVEAAEAADRDRGRRRRRAPRARWAADLRRCRHGRTHRHARRGRGRADLQRPRRARSSGCSRAARARSRCPSRTPRTSATAAPQP